jgi:hypothetical protein
VCCGCLPVLLLTCAFAYLCFCLPAHSQLWVGSSTRHSPRHGQRLADISCHVDCILGTPQAWKCVTATMDHYSAAGADSHPRSIVQILAVVQVCKTNLELWLLLLFCVYKYAWGHICIQFWVWFFFLCDCVSVWCRHRGLWDLEPCLFLRVPLCVCACKHMSSQLCDISGHALLLCVVVHVYVICVCSCLYMFARVFGIRTMHGSFFLYVCMCVEMHHTE